MHWMRCPRLWVRKDSRKFRIRFSRRDAEGRLGVMKKLMLAIVIVAMAAIAEQADAREKVQLWEGGPYWATTNIGANKPEDSGLYFWWGDTTGHRPSADGVFNFDFSCYNSVICTEKSISELKSAGWVTSDGVLAPAHDAAHVKWGGSWRMPTYQECDDLFHKCDWTWKTINGMNGYIVRGRGAYASNNIFLPCAGYCFRTSLSHVGSSGLFWSSVPESNGWGAGGCGFDLRTRSTGGRRSWGYSIRPVQGANNGEAIVSFNANGGTGTMDEQAFALGKKQKLSKNVYRKDGYVFQGWAVTTNGEVVYKDEAEIEVDSDMTLFAVWDNPVLTLTAESANWSSGSITMRCEDADKSGAAHKYTLEYKNASGVWEEVDGAKNVLATKGQDANSQEVWVTKLTDTDFSSRLGGIPPVEYRVKDVDNSRFSAPCVTRNRYGLSVGFNKYGTQATPHAQSLADARMFQTLALSKGGFSRVELLKNGEATTGGIHDAFTRWAAVVKPGDAFVFFVATHGGYDGSRAGLTAYNGLYQVSSLVYDSSLFQSGSLFLGIVMSCHSRAMVDYSDSDPAKFQYQIRNGLAQCRANSAWISSCGYDENSYISPTSSQTAFGEWFLEKGWQGEFADTSLSGLSYGGGNGDGKLTLLELAKYTRAFNRGNSDAAPSEVYWDTANDDILGMFALAANCRPQNMATPSTPVNVTSSQGNSKIDINWMPVANATRYLIYRYPLDSPDEFKWIGISAGSRFPDETATLKKEYGYRIKAVNPVGMSDFSPVAIGSRGTSKFIEFLDSFFGITTASVDEYDAMEKTLAANGCRTVGECYALGIDPEDPDDDLRITAFEMKNGEPVITVNHTEDGSGNSFEDRVKTFGAKSLGGGEESWVDMADVPEGEKGEYRFFKVGVELP